MKNPEVLRNSALVLASCGLLGGCAVQGVEQAQSISGGAEVPSSIELYPTYDTTPPIVIGETATSTTIFIDSQPDTDDGLPLPQQNDESIHVDEEAGRLDGIKKIDCSDNPIIVFGNSTDSVTGVNIEDMAHAWPALLQEKLSQDPRFYGIAVLNNAKPGVTMDFPNPWSDEAKQRWTADIPNVFAGYSAEQLASTLVILSPSIIDLQLYDGDVEKTLQGFMKAYTMLQELGINTIVTLPMNPIVDDSLMKFTYPWMPEKMREFNNALAELKLYDTSPLAVAGTNPSVGDSQYYDDFTGLGLHGELVEPDGLHPDQDGGQRIAMVLAQDENLPRILTEACDN